MSSYIIEVPNDLIEKSEPLDTFPVDIGLAVQTPELRDGGEYYTRTLAALRVEPLHTISARDNIQ